MSQNEFENQEEPLTMERLDPGVRKLISIISEHIDDVDNVSSLDEFLDGTHQPKEPSTPDVYNFLSSNPDVAKKLHGAIKDELEHHGSVTAEDIRAQHDERPDVDELKAKVEHANARYVIPSDADKDADTENSKRLEIESESVDLIITSPPYWRKRNYGVDDQLGQESDPDQYIENLVKALEHWRAFLRPHGSIFLNIGDSYNNKSRVGIPGRFVRAAQEAGWTIRNDIIWAKDNGMPSPAKDRLVPRHEHIIHLVWDADDYYYDLHGYAEVFGNGSNPGDVWRMNHDRNTGGHLAPYPEELVRRAITLACPHSVCTKCGVARERNRVRGTTELDTSRPQAERALELYNQSDLEERHIKAVQAVGISDAGKAKEFQDGAGENAKDVQELAKEAKEVLGGYFREFTFPQWITEGWTECDCEEPEYGPGMVFDPFSGSGTTIKVANELGLHAWGTDLDTSNFDKNQSLSQYQ
ncbi:DNA methylase [Halogranum rubrum]|uniref:Type II methyltransferase n=2 Tax=Halogranum rubrum TaxID=553466 RepID=A0A1I4JMJ9_9EURY|nr:DNA methylase [Halogranum rubrum]